MNLIGCDFHTRFQQIAMVNTETGETLERSLRHEGKEVEEFYWSLRGRTVVGIESTGYSEWFHELMEELGMELRVGDAAKIRAQQTRKKKTDREDARLIRRLLMEDRFPQIWVIDPEGRDLRQALKQRHRLVKTRTRAKCSLQSLAINRRLTLGPKLFTKAGRKAFEGLPLRPHARRSGQQLWDLLDWLDPRVSELDRIIQEAVWLRPDAARLDTYPGVGPATALATVLILGPVERFPSPSHVASYLGLTPSERSSGGKRRLGRISRQGSTFLRYMVVESANVAVRWEPSLRRFYRRTLRRRGVAVAKTAAARKLSQHLTVLLRDGIDYAEFVRRSSRGACLKRPWPSSGRQPE